MKQGVVINSILGIAAEFLYAIAIILAALATCLLFSLIKPWS